MNVYSANKRISSSLSGNVAMTGCGQLLACQLPIYGLRERNPQLCSAITLTLSHLAKFRTLPMSGNTIAVPFTAPMLKITETTERATMNTFPIEQPRREYATCDDFCSVLAEDLRPLYLLAFLLTGSHSEAEQCFVATIDDCVGAKSVFKGWERSWSRRCLIVNAIRIVFRASAEGRGGRSAYRAIEVESQQRFAIIGLVGITPPLRRFVFVMSVLERYSTRECALLLGCTLRDIVDARIHALTQLSAFNPASAVLQELNSQFKLVAHKHEESYWV